MVFFTGDTHGDFRRLGSKCFPEQKSMTKDDYVIVCGDFGGLWDDSEEERYNLRWLEEKPFTVLWVDGNHENFSMLEQFPVEEWHGGKVHRIRSNVIHLMRGQLYEIEGYHFFTMGGGRSHDIVDGILDPDHPRFKFDLHWKLKRHEMFRIKGISWWPEELPSVSEYDEAIETLEKANWKSTMSLHTVLPAAF